MPIELSYAALHSIGFAASAALCALLWLMQRRADRASGGPGGFQILWAVGFIWTLGNFLKYMLLLAGTGADATSLRLAGMLAWSSTIFGSLAIGRFLQAGLGTTSRAARVFLLFTGAVSMVSLGLFAWAAATYALDVDGSWYPKASFYVGQVRDRDCADSLLGLS